MIRSTILVYPIEERKPEHNQQVIAMFNDRKWYNVTYLSQYVEEDFGGPVFVWNEVYVDPSSITYWFIPPIAH